MLFIIKITDEICFYDFNARINIPTFHHQHAENINLSKQKDI